MQRRLLKQMGKMEQPAAGHDEPAPSAYDDPEPPAYEPPHVCGQWGKWGECSASCGGGLETRQYSFLDGVKCGKSCPHGDGDKQQQECNTDVSCPVDCEGSWGQYSDCSATCGTGLQARMFTITQEAMHGGKACPKVNGAMEDHECSTEMCEDHCEGHWDDWSECSNGGAGPTGQECGPGGSQTRGFTVTVEHTKGGCGCSAAMWGTTAAVDVDASTVDTRTCELPCCPEPCEGDWGEWGQCTGKNVQKLEMVVPSAYGDVPTEMCCGGGMKSKTFEVAKDKVCGGACCEAANGAVASSTCCEAPCPVPCVGDFGEFGECCSDCGGGQQEAIFIVTQEALHGGEECKHEPGYITRKSCNEHPCPVPCIGEWEEWEKCTDECGPDGTQTRHFKVTQEAMHGGKKCSEKDQVQVQPCDPEPVPCPVPAVCQWTEYGKCSACCFDTELVPTVPVMKYRKWIEITAAMHGGAECADSPPYGDSEEAPCPGVKNCSIPCIGDWGKYDKCNAEVANECGGGHFCGRGTRTKVFHITQVAKYGGEECAHEDKHKESKVCGDVPCPINCEGNFTEWGHCCSTCGGGSQSREFVVHVEAQHGGCKCKHEEHIEHQSCGNDPCPIDCEGKWSKFGDCNQECTDCRDSYAAVGQKESTFHITIKAQHGGKECKHTQGEVKAESCGEKCCPEDCEGSWSEFGACSTECGNGVTERFYHITHHENHGGKPCPRCDKASHTKACDYTSPCPVDCVGATTSWSQCSEKCGGGEKSAWFVQSVMAQHGGKECESGQFEQVTEECNTQACPKMCLGAFGPWGACDAPCSGGLKSRSFMVFRPAAGGGPECSHANGDVDTASCHEHDCPAGYVCPPTKTCKYTDGLIQVR